MLVATSTIIVCLQEGIVWAKTR